MGLLLRKGSRIRDETTSSLVRSGVYHLADTYDDEEAKKFEGPVAYSFWSAVKYTFTLSLLLWWLPVFGQMIAGYVGGRRAGSPWKGMMSALIPVAIIMVISTLVRAGIVPTVWFGIDLTPSAVMTAIAGAVPVVQPYLDFVHLYLSSFFSSLQTASSLGFDSYIITVAFAYIGGVLSQQNHRELELLARMSRGNSTTVVLEGNTFTQGPPQEDRRRSRGFEDLDAIVAAPEERDPVPLRSARRALFDEEPSEPVTLKDRRALRERAQSMAHQQRQVEKRVHRQALEEERPRPRQSADQKDWEFI